MLLTINFRQVQTCGTTWRKPWRRRTEKNVRKSRRAKMGLPSTRKNMLEHGSPCLPLSRFIYIPQTTKRLRFIFPRMGNDFFSRCRSKARSRMRTSETNIQSAHGLNWSHAICQIKHKPETLTTRPRRPKSSGQICVSSESQQTDKKKGRSPNTEPTNKKICQRHSRRNPLYLIPKTCKLNKETNCRHLKRVRLAIARCVSLWAGEALKAFLLRHRSISCQLHWVIEFVEVCHPYGVATWHWCEKHSLSLQ